ncbi:MULTISPECIES: PhoH family protein [unclassified Neptuniibacter]|uniref:PhoH family protein n=1 Tax=unclassified Neptuniibacter TaxID=2630693 RepID=UPI0026E3296B|nr:MULTISPECIES: PhoH family protein [unclassified Neptuniibacter]MDO6514784.1 PhoH family protein [Neptuniibacter sp. 2_MG-2023]MDO6593346.1 PhoH family protein [Neptuniibacter sp. 1_MG-2023]
MSTAQSIKLTLEPENADFLANLCGPFNEHLKLLEKRLGVEIRNHGNHFQLLGDIDIIKTVSGMLENLYKDAVQEKRLSPDQIHLLIQQSGIEQITSNPAVTDIDISIRTKKVLIRPRGENQQGYVRSILQHDINFGIGPAGTGKTYLAVACAVDALEREEVDRILLVRPAVEAGEKLGFLPGDLSQKVDPYLRPLYDALYEMLGFERVGKLIERNVIEVAPLAFMRGRTLNNSFVILDESQNTTREQMKMFLTRIGFGTTAVITGDITQVDLPKGTRSGLIHAMQVLDGVKDIGFTQFTAKDVVRHPLVQHIVRAYDRFEKQDSSQDKPL